MNSVILWIALIRVPIWTGAAAPNPPQGIERFTTSLQADFSKALSVPRDPGPRIRETPAFTFLREVQNSGTQYDGAWLFTYRMGETEERSPWPFAVTQIRQAAGSLLWRIPPGSGDPNAVSVLSDSSNYTDGIVVGITSSEPVIALSTPPVRFVSGSVEIRNATTQAEILFTITGSPDGASAASYQKFSESMLYFHDANGDGRKDILINRRIHTIQPGSTYKYENEKLSLKFKEGLAGVEPLNVATAELVRLIRLCKADPSIPHITQYGFPIETGLGNPPMGEAIFPSEETWRPVKYTETLPPGPASEAAHKPLFPEPENPRPVPPDPPPPPVPPKGTATNDVPLLPPPIAKVTPSAEATPKWPWVAGAIALIVAGLAVVIVLKRRA